MSIKNKVLIVDDTPENLRVLGEILTKDGHEVRVAINGTQGLEIARSAGIDLILLDVMMPDLNGYEVCAQLKKDARTKDLPVIFLTALDSSEDEGKGLGLGAVDYITKPFKVELVRNRIANQLELHNARVELRRHNEELDQLVAERSRDLAEAHRQLKTVDAAKYDFLQLIYQKLWGSESSFVSLASKSWALVDPAHPERGASLERYEASQRDLFDTMRNALLMTATGQGPRPRASTLEALMPLVRERGRLRAEPRSVELREPANQEGGGVLLAGDRDLLIQALGTFAQASALLAPKGSVVSEQWEPQRGSVTLAWSAAGALPSDEDWSGLFQPEGGLHPSPVGLVLGLDLPLAVKILLVLGGSVVLDADEEGWEVRIVLPVDQSR